VLFGTLAPPSEYNWNCVHWRHLPNTIELVLPSAHPSPHPKWQIDRFSCFCTAHGRKSLYFTMGALSPKIAPSMGDLNPHLTHDSLGLSEPTTHRASLPVLPFLHRWPHSVPILYNGYNGTPLFPVTITPSHGGSGPHLIFGSVGPPVFSPQMATQSVQPFSQGSLVWQTDRPTDHATRSITIDRIYVRSTAMRPNNNNIFANWCICMLILFILCAV